MGRGEAALGRTIGEYRLKKNDKDFLSMCLNTSITNAAISQPHSHFDTTPRLLLSSPQCTFDFGTHAVFPTIKL